MFTLSLVYAYNPNKLLISSYKLAFCFLDTYLQ